VLIHPDVLVLVNAASGSLAAPEERVRLHDLLQAAGLDAEVVEVAGGREIEAALDRHSDEIVVAAGGDGTVSTVASRLAGTTRTLGVIPGGTLNHFAKDLKIPQDLEAAVALLRARPTRSVDLAEVNGRAFINNSSLGLYPEIVREREEIRRRGFRKWTAFAAAVLGAMARWPLLRVRLEFEGRAVRRLTPFIFVGNNRYRIEGLRMGSRDSLDCGEICVCSARSMSRTGLVRMMLLGLTGGLRHSGDLDVTCARELWVDTRPRRVDVALDGEIVRLRAPLHYLIRPGALRVIAP
jgi:diacylglycerol kinase family enzyme